MLNAEFLLNIHLILILSSNIQLLLASLDYSLYNTDGYPNSLILSCNDPAIVSFCNCFKDFEPECTSTTSQ
ncbi:hypothetical protein K1719_040308 [Acacia pycnantha]|nr:hypothetical protein K1719_040308 [Acacia pycnantha]